MTKGKNRKIRLSLVYDMDNIRAADEEARKRKSKHYGVRKFDRQREANLLAIAMSIKERSFHTMTPVMEERFCDKKVRILSKVHYDNHVAHHALMRVIMPVLHKSYYYESAASIKGRGIHYAVSHTRKWIDLHKDKALYWSQVDFTKFYHNMVRQKIYDRLCKTFADEGIRWMLHDILWALGNHDGLNENDGSRGLGIGLYPIQPLVNFYLNDMDRQLASMVGFYSRYCDNMLLIDESPKKIWRAIRFIKGYADKVLQQPLHPNIGVQRLDDVHPVDYVGYLFHPDFTFVRKTTKCRFKRKFKQTANSPEKRRAVLASYKGWLQKCDGLTLWQTVTDMKRFSDFNIERTTTTRDGKRFFDVPIVSASFIVDREIIVKDIETDVETKNGGGRMCVLVTENEQDKKFIIHSPSLMDVLIQIKEQEGFPFLAFLRKRILPNNITEYYFE